jgi:hypothetical protein
MYLRTAVEHACEQFAGQITDPCGGVIIPDEEEELNWHAFLAHSLDMQGFRADWFVGRWPNPEWPQFRTLSDRGIGIRELAALWEIAPIKDALSAPAQHELVAVEDALAVLERHGGVTGHELADAFRTVRMRKSMKTIRAYLQNSDFLRAHDFSFRRYLQTTAHELLGQPEFPPKDFLTTVHHQGRPMSLETALARCLERDFYMVGPEIAPYMLCDWMLGLWRKRETGMFESFKWDSRNMAFLSRYGKDIRDKGELLSWYREQGFHYPPRVANEAIWLAMEPD